MILLQIIIHNLCIILPCRWLRTFTLKKQNYNSITHVYMHTHTLTQTHAWKQAHTCINTLTHTQSRMHRHTHTLTHMHEHTHTHTHTHTLTHAHALALTQEGGGWDWVGRKVDRTYVYFEPAVSLLVNLLADLILAVLFVGERLGKRLELKHKSKTEMTASVQENKSKQHKRLKINAVHIFAFNKATNGQPE